MARFGTPISISDGSAQREKPAIPDINAKINTYHFGRKMRDKYGVTPDSFLDTDMNTLMIKDKIASYLYTASDDNIDLIVQNSVLVIDRSLKPQVGNVVVVGVNGETLLRRLVKLHDPQKQQPMPALVTDYGKEPPIFLHHDYAEVHFKGVARSTTTFIF